MDILTVFNPSLAWLAGQLAWISQIPAVYIGVAALAPVLIALVIRDLLAALWTVLFALGAISLCAAVDVHWAVLATFDHRRLFALSAIILRRRSRVLRAEMDSLKDRLGQLEADAQRTFMQSLRSPPPNS